MSSNELKEAGLKVTTPRTLILEMLQKASQGHDTEHLSAEEIYARLREGKQEVGIATVYRVLTQFEQAGLIVKHNFEGNQSVYELSKGEHHDHLCCVDCGVIVEFVDEQIEKRQHQAAEEQGFTLIDHSLVLYGVCGNCQKKPK